MTTQYVTLQNPLAPGDVLAITIAGTTPPPPPPPPPNFTTVQAAVNAAAAGSSLKIPAGTYTEKVVVGKALTLDLTGVILTGKGLNVSLQQGLLSLQAPVNLTGGETMSSGGAGIDVSGAGSGSVITNHRAHDNTQEGYHGSSVSNVHWVSCEFDHNDPTNATFSGGEQGGGKHARCDNWTFTNCTSHDNGGGPGFWSDIYCHTTSFIGCRAWNNWGAGIMHEASYSALVDGCVCYDNGKGNFGWAWDANILVSSASGVEIRNSVVAWAHGGIDGISYVAQSRSGDYPGIKPYTGATCHDNTMINTKPDRLLTWPQPDKSSYPTAIWKGAVAANNSYYPAKPTTDQNATETGAVVLTTAQMQAVLAKYGIPAS